MYEIVATIPEGYVMTYGQIARIIGSPRASRIVGSAMYNAPSDRELPCHRVVDRHGALAPTFVFGGREYQRMLLEAEGVSFLPNGCIDLDNHLFND